MRVFDLHFNPKAKKDVVYDSFVYEPENITEKKSGNLYIIGELTNILPEDSHLLTDLAQMIKKEYYAKPFDNKNSKTQVSSEQNLRKGLKRANEFLAAQIKRGRVSWLGNLNLAILSLNDFILSFTKIGALKILLLKPPARPNHSDDSAIEIMDIGTNLEFQNVEPSPAKVFGNIATGRVIPEDKIMILTKDVFELFKKTGLIKELTLASGEKELKKIFRAKRKILSEISGICLLILSCPEQYDSEKPNREYFRTLNLRKRQIISRWIVFLRSSLSRLSLPRFTLLNNPLLLRKREKEEIAAKQHLTGLNFLEKLRSKLRKGNSTFPQRGKKFLISLFLLILILFAGYFIFQKEEKQKLEPIRQALEEARVKVDQAENALIFKDKERARFLFYGAQEAISPFLEQESSLQEEILFLQKSIEQGLIAAQKIKKNE